MKRFKILCLTALLSIVLFNIVNAQSSTETPSTYVLGNAEATDTTATFYLQNMSSCRLEEVQVRVSPDSADASTDETSLNVDLAPAQIGTFVMRLSQAASPNWQWAIDGVSLSDCAEAGQISFEQVSFAASEPAASQAEPQGDTVHTIAQGETIFVIAEQYGVTPRELMDYNDMDSEALVFGHELRIPAADGANGNFRTHTIATGDTLFSIAEEFDTEVSLIERANCLSAANSLQVDAELRIPPVGAQDVPSGC